MAHQHERGGSSARRTAKVKSSPSQQTDGARQNASTETALDVLIQRARENPHLLNSSDIIHLQRTLGNKAVSRLLPPRSISRKALHTGLHIQLKPANINGTKDLVYDATGTLTNVAAPRAKGLKRPLVINAQLKAGWVTPGTPVMGAHLVKAEFGGPDDETNVVPWGQTTEDRFSIFEDEYKAAADKDAKQAATTNTGFAATINTHATFADRPDLLVSDEDLNTAGWGPVDAKRQERKDKYAEVSERFSGIPTAVRVEVTGLTEGAKRFEVAATEIAPVYTKNPEAVKPGYVVPLRYTRNATEPRLFPKIADWTAYKKAKPKPPDDVARQKKLSHVADRHPAHFGVKNNGMAELEKLEKFIGNFIANPHNEQIVGTYKGINVLHYVDADQLWVCTTPTGELVAAFKLGDNQYAILLAEGRVA